MKNAGHILIYLNFFQKAVTLINLIKYCRERKKTTSVQLLYGFKAETCITAVIYDCRPPCIMLGWALHFPHYVEQQCVCSLSTNCLESKELTKTSTSLQIFFFLSSIVASQSSEKLHAASLIQIFKSQRFPSSSPRLFPLWSDNII